MPYTTMSNYNWLFDLDTNNINNDFSFEPMDCNAFPAMQADVRSNDMMDFDLSDLPSGVATMAPHAPIAPMAIPQQSNQQSQVSMPSQASSTNGSSNADSNSSRSSPSTKATSVSSETRQRRPRQTASKRSAFPNGLERPMTLMSANTKLPKLDALARSHILQLVESVRPVTPSGDYVTSDHAFLSLPALQTYSDLFSTRFNATYPLIHISSFEPSKVDTLLLLSVLLLGATYCEKDAHQIAVSPTISVTRKVLTLCQVCIHDVLRPQIFAHASFSAVPKLWMLQTILLVECFGKSRAGQKQHDMSHLFHGLLINLIRRSDCQIVKPESSADANGDLEDEWKSWVDAEQKKRYISKSSTIL